MTKLELVAAADSISAVPAHAEPWFKAAHGVHLKCPTCAWEVDHADRGGFDFKVKCPSCKTVAEFRQWHETWCASRRQILMRTFPDMTWLASGYSEIVPVGGARHEHLRATAS